MWINNQDSLLFPLLWINTPCLEPRWPQPLLCSGLWWIELKLTFPHNWDISSTTTGARVMQLCSWRLRSASNTIIVRIRMMPENHISTHNNKTRCKVTTSFVSVEKTESFEEARIPVLNIQSLIPWLPAPETKPAAVDERMILSSDNYGEFSFFDVELRRIFSVD